MRHHRRPLRLHSQYKGNLGAWVRPQTSSSHSRPFMFVKSTCAVNREGSLRHPCRKAPLAAAGGPAAVHPEEGGRTARSGEVLLAPLPGERKPASATLTKGRISLCFLG